MRRRSTRAIVVVALVTLGGGAGCKEDARPAAKAAPAAAPLPASPSQALVNAMGEYCRIGELPREQQRDAMKAWGWQAGGDKELGPIWHRAAALHEPAAIALVKRAAETAVGPGKCPILDALK